MNKKELAVLKCGLTLQDQLELGRRMVVYNDKKARETLILNCLPMVKSLARSFCCYPHAVYDDVFQDGMLGVLEAIDRYDYTKNLQFTSYAYYYIQRRIITGLRETLPVKVTERDYFKSSLIKSTIKSYVSNFQKEPTDKELSELTLLDIDDVSTLRLLDICSMSVSYDECIANIGINIDFTGADVAVLIEKATSSQTNRETILKALEALTDDEKEIIQERFLGTSKKPLRELSEQQGITITAVAKREKRALKKLLTYFVSHNISFNDLVC